MLVASEVRGHNVNILESIEDDPSLLDELMHFNGSMIPYREIIEEEQAVRGLTPEEWERLLHFRGTAFYVLADADSARRKHFKNTSRK